MTTTFLWVNSAYAEVSIEIEFTCAPYYPAVLGRAPDRCSPAEGGDIESIEFSAGEDCAPEALREFCEAYKADRDLQDEVDAECFSAAQSYDDGPDYY